MTNSEFMKPADKVWAASVAAQRINKGFQKQATAAGLKANRTVLLECLEADSMTPEDYTHSKEVRDFFKMLMFGVLRGDLKEFMKAAFDISTLDEVDIRSKHIQFIAALPSTYAGEQKKLLTRKLIDGLEAKSTPFGAVGDTLHNFPLTVVSSVYKKQFGCNAVNATNGANLFFFFDFREWPVGKPVVVNALIKAHYNSCTTQLARVRAVKG